MLCCVNVSCVKRFLLPPPAEERLYAPEEHGCVCSKLPKDAELTKFWLIGHKRYLEDQYLLDLCEDEGLIPRK